MSYTPVKADKRIKHGKHKTPEYIAWAGMRSRCSNPNLKEYAWYGARGIKVCPRWKDSFEAFLYDMGERPKGMTLDREDNDGNYEPGNCRWVDEFIQNTNRGILKNNTSGFTGVYWHTSTRRWCSRLFTRGVYHYIGEYKTPAEGAMARDRFIIKNNLPHKLSALEEK